MKDFRIRVPAIVLLLIMSGQAMAQEAHSAVDEMQKKFAAAYNRGDAVAMAAAFTKNAVRVTPSGIFQGREAIRRSFQDAIKMGLHDYEVRRITSRSEGSFTFNVGEWKAKVGDQPFRGYYTAIVVSDGGEPKIMEETVTVAVP